MSRQVQTSPLVGQIFEPYSHMLLTLARLASKGDMSIHISFLYFSSRRGMNMWMVLRVLILNVYSSGTNTDNAHQETAVWTSSPPGGHS